MRSAEEVEILPHLGLTSGQIVAALLAIPAFIPATICTGYLFAWSTDLYGFRARTLVERAFWSVPLSLAISTISAVLIGRVIGLAAVVVFLLAACMGCIAAFTSEIRAKRSIGERLCFGLQPGGSFAVVLAVLWAAFTIASLVDVHHDHKLFMNVSMLDQSARILWTESVLRTGVPPVNLHYLYKHPVPMRNYYFWYVDCAAIAKITSLPVRGVFTASCVWTGFGFVALIGLFLKHYLGAGDRLRRQFFCTLGLTTVTGLDIVVVLWNTFRYHIGPPADLEAWSRDGIVSWLHTIFWAPHHLVSMICCMFAFLLAWLSAPQCRPRAWTAIAVIALALASAFGLSIYVTFAFFLVMIPWALWQILFQRSWKAPAHLAAGGALSLVPLAPYLFDLVHGVSLPASAPNGAQAPHLFSLAVRQMIPPETFAATPLLQAMAHHEAGAAASLARLFLLVPGYLIELGFFAVAFLVFAIPALRRHKPLTDAQKSLLCIVVVTLPITSFIRSGVLQTNDFAWRSALFLQFPLLLLGSDLMLRWRIADGKEPEQPDSPRLPGLSPHWVRGLASLALIFGVLSTVCQALLLRFLIPIGDMNAKPGNDPNDRNLSQKAYISAIGYAELDAAIPRDAVVQYNPADQGKDRMSMIVNMLGIDHQAVITSDSGSCGSDLGGDPSGCPMLGAAVDSIFNGASADQARATCRQLGIQYLVVRVYDPVWNNKESWVWNLKPVVADEDFRALDCADN